MTPRSTKPAIPLPRGWRNVTRAGVLHAISVTAMAMTSAWSKASRGRSAPQRALAEIDRLRADVALLTEELDLKYSRWSRVPARRRPYYGPVQRMRILQLRAARGWSTKQVADRFVLTEETIASWMRRLDEDGDAGLVRLAEPVNKFPEFVAYMVRHLKSMCPSIGKVRIAQMLARAGLHLGANTVGRMLKRDLSKDDVAVEQETAPVTGSVITTKRPGHIWHVDLTTVRISGGFWVPWMPFAKFQRWPFCWWVAVVVDHASRLVVGVAIFKRRPTSLEVYSFLGMAIRRGGSKPKYIIADKGKEFFCKAFKEWCRRKGIRPRYGAVGEHGSIAIIERFIRSLKSECTRRISVPFRLDQTRDEVACYATWYNQHRPHSALGGRTPLEVYQSSSPANEAPRFEPRLRWPRRSQCALPTAKINGRRGVRLKVVVSRFENRAHLPVVELRRAA
jgi:putative transposase